MKQKAAAESQASAKASFARLIGYTFLAAIFAVAASLLYLGWNDLLTIGRAFGIGSAVFVAVMLGAGLMATGFYSDNVGHDEKATNRSGHKPLDRTNDE